MKWFFTLIVALVIGGLAGSWIKNLPGFVIIAIDKTTYEMRLWIAACFVILLILVLFAIVAVIRAILSGSGRIKLWTGNLGFRRARKKTIDGMLAFTEGRWKVAEDAMISAVKHSDAKLINYLIAAQAAQHQKAEVRRDTYLRRAYESDPEAKTAIRLTQAQLQLQHGQFEQALASLNELKQENPNHPYVLKLLSRLYEELQDWQQMIELLPALKKHHVYFGEQLNHFEFTSVKGLLKQQAAKGQVEGLKDTWQNLSSGIRKRRENIKSYVELLIELREMDEAEKRLRDLLKSEVDKSLIILYSQALSSDPQKQLGILENIQRNNNLKDHATFLSLGKLAYQAKLWGKARQYLEKALQFRSSSEAYLYMAKTLSELGEYDHASDCYRLGLESTAQPNLQADKLTLPSGSADLVSAELLPKFQKVETSNKTN